MVHNSDTVDCQCLPSRTVVSVLSALSLSLSKSTSMSHHNLKCDEGILHCCTMSVLLLILLLYQHIAQNRVNCTHRQAAGHNSRHRQKRYPYTPALRRDVLIYCTALQCCLCVEVGARTGCPALCVRWCSSVKTLCLTNVYF